VIRRCGLRVRARERLDHIGAQCPRDHLPRIDHNVEHRDLIALRVEALRSDHHFAEILLVLDPVQLDLQSRKLFPFKAAFFEQRIDRLNDHLSVGSGRFPVEVIQLDDHRVLTPAG
jgi:hypothetical protein